MRSRWTYVIVAALVLALTAGALSAATLNVPSVDYPTIQAAVDAAIAGDTIVIAAGTYVEQVHITTSNLTLSGGGVGSTVIQSPATLTDFFTTSKDHYPVVFIDGVDTVVLEDLTVDGDKQGKANKHFEGIAFWNSGGTLAAVEVINIMDNPFSGSQHGVGIYAYNDTGSPYTIVMDGVEVYDFQKNALALNGDGLTIDLDGVDVTGAGETTVTAQNGIQVSHGAGGTITDCTVTGIAYADSGWVATGILLYEGGTVDIDGATATLGCQDGVIYQETQGSITGLTGTASNTDYAEGISVRDYGYAMSRNGLSVVSASPFETGEFSRGRGATTNVTIDGATLTGDAQRGYGIASWCYGDDTTVDVTDCTLTDWSYALVGYESGATLDMSVDGCDIDGNLIGFWSNAAAPQLAEANWWGDASGPGEDGPGTGDGVSGSVDYSPWFAETPYTSPMKWGTDDSIQDVIDLATAGDIIEVVAGTYAERLTIGKEVHLRGAQYGVDPTPTGARVDPNAESIITEAGLSTPNPDVLVEVTTGGANASVDGFTLNGDPTNTTADTSVLRIWADGFTLGNNIIDGMHGVVFKGGDALSVATNRMTVNKGGVTCQPDASTNATMTGNTIVLGTSPVGDESGIYMTSATDATVSGNTVSGFTSRGIGGSSNTNVEVVGNAIDSNRDGVSMWGNTTFLTVDGNDITNSTRYGINVKGQDIDITGNVFSGSDIGVAIDKHTLTTERVVVSDNDFSGCLTQGLEVTTAVLETVDASANYWGSIDAMSVQAEANGGSGADYTPWLAGGTPQNPGYAGDYSALYVDDDSPQTSGGRIQEGIDLVSGSTVNVAAGTYAEQLTIDKSLSLIGAGETATLIQPGAYPVINVTANDVSISDLAVTDPSELAEGIKVNATANLTLTRVNFPNLGAGAGVNAYGVDFVEDFSGLTVTDCEFAASTASHGVNARNIGIFAPKHLALGDFSISGCAFDYIWTSIYISSGIDGLDVTGCTFGPVDPANFTACVAGIYIGDGDDDDFDLRNVSVTGNTFTDYGRGVYVWNYGANSTVENFVISGNTFANSAWSSAIRFIIGLNGMENYSIDGIDINNNIFTQDSGVGGYIGLIDMRTYDATLLTCDISIADNVMTFTGAPYTDAMCGIGFLVGGDGFYNTTVARNGISGGSTGGAGTTPSSGVRIQHYADGYTWTHALDLDIFDNAITGFDHGISVYDDIDASYGGLPAGTDVAINGNSIVNDLYGVRNDDGVTVNAEDNWWGDPTGPYHPTSNPGGFGSVVSNYVDFDPYRSGNIVCDPDPLDLTVASPSGDIDVNYLGGGSGLVYGYNITVTWDDTVADLTGITEGSLLSDTGATTLFFVSGTGNTRTIDCALTGSQDGVSGPGTMFTLSFTEDSYGQTPVDITVVKVRDKDNQTLTGFYEDDGLIRVDTDAPTITRVEIFNDELAHTDDYAKDLDDLTIEADIDDDYGLTVNDIEANLSALIDGGATDANPDSYDGTTAVWDLDDPTLGSDGSQMVVVTATDGLGNSSTGSDDIVVDNTAPGMITGFDAAPAHEEVELSWDDPTGLDANYYGVLVRYDAWGDYPQYATSAPAYPADETVGDGEAFDGTGSVIGGTHTIVPRDIHYYSAFVYDWALNYGPVDSGGQDRATNYWLGDVAEGLGVAGYDGEVGFWDVDLFGGGYATIDPVGGTAEFDFGPTDDYSRLGIPEPDDVVDFEDLMILAMNYGVVSARIVPFLPETPEDELMLALSEVRSADGTIDVAIRLEGNTGEVKGLSAEIAYDPNDVEFVSAQLTEDMDSPIAPVFFWHGENDASVQVDLAVLGTGMTIGGCGDVAVLTFRPVSGEFTLEFTEATLRDAANEELTAELGGYDSKGDVPETFRLVQNTPNPFNPVTTVGYHVPTEAPVSIRVYDVSGRLVRTLVDGVVEPGRHQAVWDGRSDHGEAVGSGIYFCVMETPDYRGSHKMTLLK